MEDKPWRNEQLRSLEERLPRLKEETLEQAVESCKATENVGCDGFCGELQGN